MGGAYPGRFIPLALSGFPLGDEWMAGEIARVAEKGCHAVSFHSEPHRFGTADIHGPEWDQAWQACNDLGTVAVFHFGGFPNFMPRTPFSVIPHAMPFQTSIFAAELLWSPIMQKFPKIKMSLAEGGIGWVPYFLEKADFVYDHHRAWTGADFGDKLPSEVFREHVQTCFIDDYTGLRNRHQIGVDMITWEADYPHSDSTWPESPEVADEVAGRGRPPRRPRSTWSRGRTRAAGTSSTRSSTAPARSARWVRCGRRPPTSTRRRASTAASPPTRR